MVFFPDSGHSVRVIKPAFLRNQASVVFSENERLMLDLVRRYGPISRAGLARESDLTMQSVVRLVDVLSERGFLRFGEKVANVGPGQPSRPLSLVPDAAFTYGISIMTDAVSVCVMDLSGKIRAVTSAPVDISSKDAVVKVIRIVLSKLAGQAKAKPDRVFGAGIAVSGYFVAPAEVNPPTGMNAWALHNLEADLQAALEMPVWIENNGNAAAAGESLYGVGRRHKNFAYIYIATGLGGGLVINGEVQRGHRGNAGEFTGLLPLKERGDRPTLNLLIDILNKNGVPISGIADLRQRFQMDWPGVQEWLDRAQSPLTHILSAIGAVIDPEAIVIGGRIPPELAKALAERAQYFREPRRARDRPVPIVLAAEAPGDAAAFGAAALPLKANFFR